jgi:hypothetical protein
MSTIRSRDVSERSMHLQISLCAQRRAEALLSSCSDGHGDSTIVITRGSV